MPLIFFGPDVPSALNMSTVRSVDVAPTVLELLGARPSRARFDGCSLATTILAGAPVAARPAFAQAYAAEQGAYLAFMRRLALTGRKTGSLAHRLLSEVVYEGDWRLERKHTEYVALGDGWRLVEPPRQLRLQRFDGCAWLDAHDAVRLADLDAQLDAYNARRRARSRVAPMTAEVRAQLAAMGYRV